VEIAAVAPFAPDVCAFVAQGVGVRLVWAISAYDFLHDANIVFRPLQEQILLHSYLAPPDAAGQ
jgi:hypothetical protein